MVEEFINITKLARHVNHQWLTRYCEESETKSVCPVCNEGMLLMYRDRHSLCLRKDDRCTRCGQEFIYDDVMESINLQYGFSIPNAGVPLEYPMAVNSSIKVKKGTTQLTIEKLRPKRKLEI